MDPHPEVEAVLTRESDRTVALEERTELANAGDAHLVSIHCNAAEEFRAHGAEVWCFATIIYEHEGLPAISMSPGHFNLRRRETSGQTF